MKRALTAIAAALVLSLGTVSVAAAQDSGTNVVEEATNDNGDTGLLGLLGLIGLAGLFGLKRRDDHRVDHGTTDRNLADRDRSAV